MQGTHRIQGVSTGPVLDLGDDFEQDVSQSNVLRINAIHFAIGLVTQAIEHGPFRRIADGAVEIFEQDVDPRFQKFARSNLATPHRRFVASRSAACRGDHR